MKYDLPDLLTIFDTYKTSPLAEAKGHYDFEHHRSDGRTVHFSFAAHDGRVGAYVSASDGTTISSVSLTHCASIEVMDMTEGRRHVQIWAGKEKDIRVFLSLDGDNMIDVSYEPDIRNWLSIKDTGV